MKNKYIVATALTGLALLSGCQKEYQPKNPIIKEKIITVEHNWGGYMITHFHTRRDPEIKGTLFIKQLNGDSYGQRTISGQYQDYNKDGKVNQGDLCFAQMGEQYHLPIEDRFICSTHDLRTVHTEHPRHVLSEDYSDSVYPNGKIKMYSTDGIIYLRSGIITPQQSIEQVSECMSICREIFEISKRNKF